MYACACAQSKKFTKNPDLSKSFNLNSHFDIAPETQSNYINHPPMHLINQNAPPESIEEDDEDDDDDEDSEQGGNDVSKVCAPRSMSMSVSATCYSDSLTYKKISSGTMTTTSAYATPFVPNESLRRRNVKNVMHKTATKAKCVQFMPLPNVSDHEGDDNNDEDSSIGLITKKSSHYSKPLKKIVFNGTFPIDDPYSSRF